MIKNKNKITLENGKEIIFNFDIKTVLEYSNCFVILLMNGDNFPDNNVEVWDYDGKKLWNIEELIKFKYPDTYTYIVKGTRDQLITRTYSGVRFVINLTSKTVIDRSVTQ